MSSVMLDGHLPPAGPARDAAPALRVCFVNLGACAALAPTSPHVVGGEEVQHALLASTLAARRGLRVSLVGCDLGQGARARIAGIDVHACYTPGQWPPGLRFLPRWLGLHRALAAADADVYYVSCAGALLGQVACFTSLHRRALVFRVASDGDCDPRRMLVGSRKERVLYRFGLRRARRISVQTEAQRRMLETHFGRDARVLPMLVEAPGRISSPEERDIDLLWVANLRALKQPQRLVALARRLPHRRVHLVGGAVDGEPDVARELQAAAAGVSNLRLHGRLGYRDTLQLFDRARLFVSTSRIEGFPNTFLQAWVRGVPTVSHVDPDDLILRRGLGAVAGDEASMAAAIEQLLAEPGRLQAAGDRCLAYVRERHSKDAAVDAMLDLLAEAVAPRRP